MISKTMKVHSYKEFRKDNENCPETFPMELLSEEMAQRNHGQSLDRLNERGGLAPQEIIANVTKQRWMDCNNISNERAVEIICKYINNHNSK